MFVLLGTSPRGNLKGQEDEKDDRMERGDKRKKKGEEEEFLSSVLSGDVR